MNAAVVLATLVVVVWRRDARHFLSAERRLEVRSFTTRYGSTTVVDDVSLQLHKGETTSVIGPNSVGISTLLGMMSRLLRMDAGSVTVDGLGIATTPGDVRARKMSLLRQSNHFEARINVEDLVIFGRFPYSKGRPRIECKAHVDRAIEYLELNALRHRYLDQLSGGQQQRAFVSMVLAQDTDYVLLDEPLNDLDMRHSIAMVQRLRCIVSDFDKTVMIVLHDTNFELWDSDEIIAMRDGKVAYRAGLEVVITTKALMDVRDVEVTVETIQGKSVGVYYGAMSIASTGNG